MQVLIGPFHHKSIVKVLNVVKMGLDLHFEQIWL